MQKENYIFEYIFNLLDEIIIAIREYHARMYELEGIKFEYEYEVARKDYEARYI